MTEPGLNGWDSPWPWSSVASWHPSSSKPTGGRRLMNLVLTFWNLSPYWCGLSFQKLGTDSETACCCYWLDFTSFSCLSPASCGGQGPCTAPSPQHDAPTLTEVLILLTAALPGEPTVGWVPRGQVTWVSQGVWLLWIRCCDITFCVTPLNSDTTLEADITHYSYFIDEERSIYRGSKVTCQQTRPILNLPLDQCSLPGGNTQEKNESHNSRSVAVIHMIFGQQNYVTWISGYVSLLQHPHTRLYFFFNMTRMALQNIHLSLLTQIPLIALWYPQCWWPVSGIPYIISKIKSEC